MTMSFLRAGKFVHGQQAWVQGRISYRLLAILAATSIALWQIAEYAVRSLPHPDVAILKGAASAAAAAQREILRLKEEKGLVQPASIDPNRTGLIGPDWSEIATTIGDVTAKRTATNPDLAAVIVRALRSQGVEPGQTIGMVLSGSFVGANIAAIAAVEAMQLKAVVISSLGASMYGGTDPDFTWLDMEKALARTGVIRSRSLAVVAGGESAIGNSLSEDGRAMLKAAAERNGYVLDTTDNFQDLKETLKRQISRAAPQGLAAFVSAGGAVLSIGTCTDAFRLSSGIIRGRQICHDGVPGLIHDYASGGTPVLHVLNMRRFALDWGLPYDPIPLPQIGQNPKIYGRVSSP